MVFVVFAAAIVVTFFVSFALFLPVWALAVTTALAAGGILLGARVANRHDEVAGALGIFLALLLGLGIVVQWAVFLFTHI